MPAAVRPFRPAARWAAWGEGPTTTGPAAAARRTAPGRARALFATSMKTANCASVSKPTVAVRGASVPESDDHAGQPRSATAAVRWRESRRCRWRKGSGTAGLLGGREAATGGGGIPRRGDRKHRPHRGLPARFRHASAEPPRDVLQLPDRHPEREHDHAGADADHAGDDQRVAGTEFLDRNSVADRQQARQNKADPGDQHNKHHRTNPSAAPETLASRPRHDTVILCAPPTANCVQGSAIASFGCRIPVADDHAAIQVPFSPPPVVLPPTNYCPFVALHQGFRPQFPITWKWNCAIWVPGE